MKMMARMSPVAEQKTARDALVLPVDAQAARRAPARWACVNAAVMPLSLKLPDGFKPSYCKNREPGFKPTKVATLSARCKMVCPSPMVRILSGWAKGSSSRKRQTPLRLSGLARSAHLASKADRDFGGFS